MRQVTKLHIAQRALGNDPRCGHRFDGRRDAFSTPLTPNGEITHARAEHDNSIGEE
jgi:hypothetical protein